LFAALLIFAQNDLPRRTKKLAALMYIPMGIATCFASGAVAIYFAGDLMPLLAPHEQQMRIRGVSPDGDYVLVLMESGKKSSWRDRELISIDMERKQAHIIDRDYTIPAQLGPLTNSIMYVRGGEKFLFKVGADSFRFSRKR